MPVIQHKNNHRQIADTNMRHDKIKAYLMKSSSLSAKLKFVDDEHKELC